MRRSLAIIAVLLGLVPAVAIAAARPDAVVPAKGLEAAVVAELNAVRLEHGLEPLRRSDALASAAGVHSREMVIAGYFAHESVDGTPFWARVKQFYGRGASGRWLVGENLFWQAPSASARDAVRAWLQSPSHRANVLRPGFREVGVAAVRSPAAPGVYGQRGVVVLTVNFGSR